MTRPDLDAHAHFARHELTAWIVGDGTMLIPCAEHLLDQGHLILGVLTDSPDIKAWAERSDIRSVGFGDDYMDALRERTFDYLFSIVNLRMLPSAVLEIPRQLAINFHDGPLPRYAGINATTWATLNQETSHGVTWHIMEDKADAGDILKSRTVSITANDTTASLNMKCYEAGIVSFQDLIGDITGAAVDRREQDFRVRSYFGKNKRPEGAGLISWHADAAQTHALYRAFDFGTRHNNFGLLKFRIGSDHLLIRGLKVLEASSDASPGTIVDLTDEGIQVATATDDLVLSLLHTLDGLPLSVPSMVAHYELCTGHQFDAPDPALTSRMAALWQSVCRYEADWVQDLELEHAEIPYVLKPGATATAGQAGLRDHPVDLADEVTAFLHADNVVSGNRTAASLLAFLSRLTNTSPLRISVSLPESRAQIDGLERDFTALVPMSLTQVGPDTTFSHYCDLVEKSLDTVRKRGPMARDITARSPYLSAGFDHAQGKNIPLVLAFGSQSDAALNAASGAFMMIVDPENQEPFWRFDPDIFAQHDISRLCDQYAHFLNGLVQYPTCRLVDIPIVPEDERAHLITHMNRTTRDYLRRTPVHILFAQTARRRSAENAVVCGGDLISYGELDRKSTALGGFLNARNIGKGDLVGIFLDRSVDTVMALLGVLKSGAAYVPLDPIYPQDRLAAMIEDSAVSGLITTTALETDLPPHSAKAIRLDVDWSNIDELSRNGGALSSTAIGPEDLAYVIFTSGSSGRPKGVRVTHGGLTNFMFSMAEVPGLVENDTLLALTTVCFDIAALELFLPLIVGAVVEVVPTDICRDGPRLMQHILASDATVVQATPATWHMLLDAGWEHNRPLKALCGGEALQPELASRLLNQCTELWNLFGPTETTIWSSCCKIDDAKNISIGSPIANTQFYVLDAHQEPTPLGVPGELYIAGDGVAAGYLNRPDLTASCFVTDPFGGGGKMYRTGDLVRYRADGTLRYMARIDNQVKVRGYRIELQEIEAVLKQDSRVVQAAVIVDEDAGRQARILAYVVVRRNAGGEVVVDLREQLKARLPLYMVPSAIRTLDRLPLTPNGKLDRRALPTSDGSALINATPLKSTSGFAIEADIAAIWQALIGRDEIGLHESFFDAGGNSLLLTTIILDLGKRFGRRFTTLHMFEHPTIHSFAAFVRDSMDGGASDTSLLGQGASPGPKTLTRRNSYGMKRRLMKSVGNRR